MVADSPREILKSLYEEHAQAVWAYARAITQRRDLAEDLAADAFLALTRRLRERGMPPDPLGYLLASVRSRAIDEFRRRKAIPLGERPLPAPLDTRAESVERRERILIAIGSLEAPLAEAIALRIFAGLTFEQSARLADIPRGTMESRYALALEKLSLLLREERV